MTLAVNAVYTLDALELLRQLDDGSVDCIITDPPYGVGKADWDDHFPTEWIAEAWRVSSRIIVMTGNPELIEVGVLVGQVQNVVVMNARNSMTRSKTGFANWFPALICGDWKWGARPNHMTFNITINEDIPHPSPKPLAAMMKLIQHYTEPEWLIVDPFCGSGTTGVACIRQGRKFIGGDMSPEYTELSRRRIASPYTLPMFVTSPEDAP